MDLLSKVHLKLLQDDVKGALEVLEPLVRRGTALCGCGHMKVDHVAELNRTAVDGWCFADPDCDCTWFGETGEQAPLTQVEQDPPRLERVKQPTIRVQQDGPTPRGRDTSVTPQAGDGPENAV